ncbi:Zn(2)-C6 fungal-type domain-containing protein [Pleurotus pulmonarius]
MEAQALGGANQVPFSRPTRNSAPAMGQPQPPLARKPTALAHYADQQRTTSTDPTWPDMKPTYYQAPSVPQESSVSSHLAPGSVNLQLPSDSYRTADLSTLAQVSSELGYVPDPMGHVSNPSAPATSSNAPGPNLTRGDNPSASTKKRRPKPKIQLAPDQPPTTQGKPRARVYLACLQCRQRKTRCDGAKPICHNCSRRENGGFDCSYDAQPRRRGPDKMPGARQRQQEAEEGLVRRRRRRQETTQQSDSQEPSDTQSHINPEGPSVELLAAPPEPPTASQSYFLTHYGPTQSIPLQLADTGAFAEDTITPPVYPHGFIVPLDENGDEVQEEGHTMTSEPSVNFTRKIWWDSLLSLYINPYSPPPLLTNAQREMATAQITADLQSLFHISNYWFYFFHLPTFFGKFCHPTRREQMQPSLLLALLGMSVFFKSSEVENGHEGRCRALRLMDEAQSAMHASYNSGWIDEELVQAAWLQATFEACAHPCHSTVRSSSAMVYLDSLIRSLALTTVDAGDPGTSCFEPGAVPHAVAQPPAFNDVPVPPYNTVGNPLFVPSQRSIVPVNPFVRHAEADRVEGCSCNSYTLATRWPASMEHVPLWAYTPAWDESWDEGQIRRESCRRLCWSAMTLAAGFISYMTAHKVAPLDLFIADPANYAILFNGECYTRAPNSPDPHSPSPKDTIWALHDRLYLLWHSCMRARTNTITSNEQKAQFARSAWLEADSLEQALSRHTCNLERAYIYQGREYLFNIRMYVSHEFSRHIPAVTSGVTTVFNKQKAEEWLKHQAAVAQRVMHGLSTVTGHSTNLLSRRPFFVFWFMGQIQRALTLWEADHSLTVALDNCKALLRPIDYLTSIWPCNEQRARYLRLRKRLAAACHSAGHPPPPPMDPIMVPC